MTLRPALLRDERVLAVLAQLVVAALAIGVLAYAADSVLDDMRARGLVPGLGFLEQQAGFGISEGPAYSESDSYGRAFYVGLANTLRVSVAGIALATLLGLLVALARLSGNPLATRLSTGYIELFRNTPLLVQLVFWYRGVVLRLPGVGDSLLLHGPVTGGGSSPVAFLSQRGLAIPRFVATPTGRPWLLVVGAGIVLGVAVWHWRERRQAETGEPARGFAYAAGTAFVIAAASWLLSHPRPFGIDLPQLGRFGYDGGHTLSPEFAALLFGLVAYTGAFIAEVIRSGIESVTRGQREAARAVGLTEGQVMRLVVLPQALRVIVPPLTSQYLNLVKNSSLAIYIGFPDLFNVGLTIGNQTGQFVIVTLIVMAVYLAISLLTSLVMNVYNRRIRLVER
jgi:general L-amino acid transport system permease protein